MFYQLLKQIEENNSLPVGSIFSIEDGIKSLALDWGWSIDISFLLKEKYIIVFNTPKYKVWEEVVLQSPDYSGIYYTLVTSIRYTTWKIQYIISALPENLIDEDELRPLTDIESDLFI